MFSNNGSPIYYTGTAFVSPDIATAGPPPGVFTAQSNAPYVFSDLGALEGNFAMRIVAAGLRMRYTGTELDRGGQIIALQDPTHQTMVGRSPAEMLSEVQTRSFPVTRDWITLLYKPLQAADVNYAIAAPLGTNDYYMAFWIQAAAYTATFEFEAYAILEYQGVTIRGQTPSHTDPVGFAAVHSASTQANALNISTQSDQVREKNAIASTLDYLTHGISGATHAVSNITKSAQALGGALSEAAQFASILV
jgi:hypothetical protein